jgi:hypothetical protein
MNRTLRILILLSLVTLVAACGRDRGEASDAGADQATVEVAPPDAATEAPSAVEPTEAPAEETEAPAQDEETSGEEAIADAAASPLVESPLSDGPSPLATPVAEPPALDVQTSTETGAVIGRVMLVTDTEVRPVADMKVALADVLLDDDGIPRIAGYDPATPLRTMSDELGRFAIEDVAPATYAIILDAVTTSVMLADPITGDPILIEVDADAVTDIGRLNYDSLALPGYTTD